MNFYLSLKILLATSLVVSLFLKDHRVTFAFLATTFVTFYIPELKSLARGFVKESSVLDYQNFLLYWYLFMASLNLLMAIFFRRLKLHLWECLVCVTILQSVVFLIAVLENVLPQLVGFNGFDLFYHIIKHKLLLTVLSSLEVIVIWMSYGKRTFVHSDLGGVSS